MTTDGLAERVKQLGFGLGFARVGIARAERLSPVAERLDAWLAAGYHGGMDYMRRTADVRVDPNHPGMLAEARSVVVLAAAYPGVASPAPTPSPGRIARYAQGRDYHNVLHRRLKGLIRLLRSEGFAARASVDSMPVMERAWAQRAGIGFIGKNCCLIVPGLGSHVFLCAVITSAPLDADSPMSERCGDCRLCLERCPTRAFVSARVMDARRCISYLTIEHRGCIDDGLRPEMEDWLFGCDACQDVCPYNRAARAAGAASSDFAASARWERLDAEALLQMDDARFAIFAAGSPLRRARREGIARNSAIVLGNRGSRRALRVLDHAAEADPSGVVRETAAWAAARIRMRSDTEDGADG
jgi:epoxyqueuosine reductase